ncbi:hypothetical protein GGU10DRAFT_380569 [Lentinula aff. detonsa]|uniref:Uncharacterized protein n=1 Tax=Lentinula aff. detonsa TaxID=2804958 RepID=A0AA38KTF5_9AGAR|nr:hypothetical protein GGU10DRAFT_380569 [Lentinula aff. detonsa]
MSSPKPNETSAHPKTPAHDRLPHPQQQVGHPVMPGGPGSGALLNHFGSATPALVHG